MRPLPGIFAFAVTVTLASEILKKETVPQPSSPPASHVQPSLVLCAALCLRRQHCQAVSWQEGCRLFEDVTNDGTGTEQVQLYRRLTPTSRDVVTTAAATTTDITALTTALIPTTSSEVKPTTVTTTTMMMTTTALPSTTGSVTADTNEATTKKTTAIITTDKTATTSATTGHSTSTPPGASCDTPFTMVDGHCLQHVSVNPNQNFASLRSHCKALAHGGDLASVHSMEHLKFFWNHRHRHAFEQWIGVEVDSNGVFRNVIDNSVPEVNLESFVMEGDGKYLAIPKDKIMDKLNKREAGASLSGGVCEAPSKH